MLAIFVNDEYIGSLANRLALDFGKSLCVNVGDTVELYTVDMFGDIDRHVLTFYHNSTGILTVEHGVGENDRDLWDMYGAEPQRKSHVRTGKGYHGLIGSGESMAYRRLVKRTNRRMSRREGKSAIAEQA